MANFISNQYMGALLKTVYLSGVVNAKSQNSTLLSQIDKDTFVGKEMKYAVQYGNGGNFGADYSALVNTPTDGARNAEWTMTPGYLAGVFTISQPEILQSDSDKAAYMKIVANKMSACFDGLSKTLAIFLYGGKFGVIDNIQEEVTFANGTKAKLPITSAGSIKLDIGSRIVFASAGSEGAALPWSALAGTGAYATVSEIDDTSITVVPEAGLASVTLYKGDYIELYGTRDTSQSDKPSAQTAGMEGLSDLIPTVADRTGTTWETYIAEDFRGIDRSVAVNRLAGQFVKAEATGEHRLTDAITKLIKKTKRQGGGVNNILVINDNDFEKVQKEADLTRTMFTSTESKGKKNATFGLSDFNVFFGEADAGNVIIDPFCPEGYAYSLDKNDLKFFDLGNMGRVIAPVANGQIGKYDIESVGDQGLGNDPKVSLNTDKLFTVTQGTAGRFGPTFNVAANLFGAFSLQKTASSGVVVLK